MTNSWFEQMLSSARDMPLELATNLDMLPLLEKQNALDFATKNMQRILSFAKLSDENFSEDPEQFWVDAIIRIEDASYYACMLLPYLRQVIEDNAEFTHIPSDFNAGTQNDESLLCILKTEFNSVQADVLFKAINIANKIKVLDENLYRVKNSSDFCKECIIAYSICADLISLSCCFYSCRKIKREC